MSSRRSSLATQPHPSDTLRFDAYELNVRAGELLKHGRRLRLRGQPLEVLQIMLEHPGDLVTREEFQTRIWPADTFVDFDHSLNNAIARLREVLGDSAESPRYIETVPRRGYRFIGPVDLQTLRLPVEPVTQAHPGVLVPHRKRNLTPVLVLCGFFALGLVAWASWRSVHAKAAVPAIDSIAVLPLDNLSGDPSEEFFVDGMTDQLITDLAKVATLRVVSRTSVIRYKGTKKSMPEIARELNVDAIVEGSVVRSGNRVRVTAQLIKANADRHLWAETYDGDISDVLKLQSEVTEAIAREVRAQLSPQQQTQLRSARAVNPAAYNDYLQGRLYFSTEFYKPESVKKAEHLFEQAAQKDPNFALAYAGLGDTYVYLAYSGNLQRELAYRSAKEALAKAVDLDESIGEAHDTLGLLSADFDWDWDTADREFKRAIALAPSYSCAHEDRANFLSYLGRRAETLEEIARIQQLDYTPVATWTVSNSYYQLRDYPALIEASKRGLLLIPNDPSQHYFLGVAYESTGKFQEAISEYQTAVQLSSDAPDMAVALAHAYSAAGKKAEAQEMLRALQRKSKESPVSPYTMATIHAGLGENDKAYESLEKCYAEKSFGFPSHLRSDPLLDSLRPDPRFQDLLSRVGLKN